MNLKISLLVAGAFVITLSAFAKTPQFVITGDAGASVYNVLYKGSESGKVKISIFNAQNEIVFSETLLNVTSFKRPYNFSQMGVGEYTIMVESKNGRQVERITHAVKKLTTSLRVVRLSGTDHRYMLHVLNNGSEEVYIRIYDNLRGLLHEEKLQVTGSNGLIYNLSQARVKPDSIVIFEALMF
jgi:hypothetical protein